MVMTHAAKGGESAAAALHAAADRRQLHPQGIDRSGLSEIEDGAFVLRERAPGVSVAEIVAKTAGRLIVPEQVPEMRF